MLVTPAGARGGVSYHLPEAPSAESRPRRAGRGAVPATAGGDRVTCCGGGGLGSRGRWARALLGLSCWIRRRGGTTQRQAGGGGEARILQPPRGRGAGVRGRGVRPFARLGHPRAPPPCSSRGSAGLVPAPSLRRGAPATRGPPGPRRPASARDTHLRAQRRGGPPAPAPFSPPASPAPSREAGGGGRPPALRDPAAYPSSGRRCCWAPAAAR